MVLIDARAAALADVLAPLAEADRDERVAVGRVETRHKARLLRRLVVEPALEVVVVADVAGTRAEPAGRAPDKPAVAAATAAAAAAFVALAVLLDHRRDRGRAVFAAAAVRQEVVAAFGVHRLHVDVVVVVLQGAVGVRVVPLALAVAVLAELEDATALLRLLDEPRAVVE